MTSTKQNHVKKKKKDINKNSFSLASITNRCYNMKFSHLPRNNLNRISDISIMEGQANIFPPKLLCNLTMIGLAIYAQDRISTPMLESMIIASKKETSTMYTQFHSTENQFSVLPSESLITDKQPNTENTVQNP